MSAVSVKPSDLKYRYPRVVETRGEAKFLGPHDPVPFNRNDLYDVLPLLEAAMNDLGRDDARALHVMEDLLNQQLPHFISSRGDVFRFLTECMRDVLDVR